MRPPRVPRRRAASLAGAALIVLAPLGVLQSSSADPADGRSVGASNTEPRTHRDPEATDATDALGGVLGGELVAAAKEGEDPDYPGLPALTGFQWDGVSSTGITTIPRSRQTVRLPVLAIAADVGIKLIPPPPGYTSSNLSTLKGYVVSPPGSPHPYGDMPRLGVRTLAFGALPVTATVVITQPRDANDLPIGLRGSQTNPTNGRTGVTRYDNATLAGEVQLRLTDLAVDGVPVDVGGSCRTAELATITLAGRGYFRRGADLWQLPDPRPTPATRLTQEQVERDYYVQAVGGLLTGTLDVPEFTGCTGPAGDISALVSSAVSGDGQPVSARQSTTFNCFPPDKVTMCDIPDEFPYPDEPGTTAAGGTAKAGRGVTGTRRR